MIHPRGIRLLMKWPGNKWGRIAKLAGEVLGLDKRPSLEPLEWVEPFHGGMGLTSWLMDHGQLHPQTDIIRLSDASLAVHQVAKVCRDSPELLEAELEALVWDASWVDHYAVERARFNGLSDQMRQEYVISPAYAALAIWLSRSCTNGLWRTNRKGEMNQSRGRYAALKRPPSELLTYRSSLLQGAFIELSDWSMAPIMAPSQSDSAPSDMPGGRVIALDPPYIPLSSTSCHVGYTAGGFDEEDQWQLSLRVRELAEEGNRILLFGQNLPMMRALYPPRHFLHTPISVIRTGACKGAARGSLQEVIVTLRKP